VRLLVKRKQSGKYQVFESPLRPVPYDRSPLVVEARKLLFKNPLATPRYSRAPGVVHNSKSNLS